MNRRKAGVARVAGVVLLAALVVGGYFGYGHFLRETPTGNDFAIWDDPKRSFSLPNDTGAPRLVRRCEYVDECRSPDEGRLVQPGESFDFKVYYDEDRTYVVANTQGRTFGCVTVPVAACCPPYPESLSDLIWCPRGTPKIS